MTPAERRQRLWAEAQGPRSPRSPEYMAGIAAALDLRSGAVEHITCPHAAGTAASDAWHAGAREGHDRWSYSLEAGEQ